MNNKPTLKDLQKIMGTQGGSLDLRGTNITALPDNLTVGGWLDLRGTNITALPDNLTVGGWLYLGDTNIKNPRHYKNLKYGDYVPKRYLYADDILTHIKAHRKVGEYVYFQGKIKGRNVIFDGKNYAHCKDLRSGIADLKFKAAIERGAEQYRNYTIDSVITKEQAIEMYRVITGACQQGTQNFIDNLPRKVSNKANYTIGEIIDITKGQYGAETFKKFFEE